jgi:hypothetical protein
MVEFYPNMATLFTYTVAVGAVDLPVGPVAKVARVERVFAAVAVEALLVVERTLGNLLLGLKDATVASEKTKINKYCFKNAAFVCCVWA